MTKRTATKAGHSGAARTGPAPDVTDEAMVMWVTLIAEGNRERHAASLVEAKHGVGRNTLRSYADRHPEWKERLDQAHEAVRNALQRVVFDTATVPNLTEEPAAVKNRMTAALAMLPHVDREGWTKREERTGANGGPIQSEVRITLADAEALAKDGE